MDIIDVWVEEGMKTSVEEEARFVFDCTESINKYVAGKKCERCFIFDTIIMNPSFRRGTLLVLPSSLKALMMSCCCVRLT